MNHSHSHGSPDHRVSFSSWSHWYFEIKCFQWKWFRNVIHFWMRTQWVQIKKSALKMRLCLPFMWINSLNVDKRSDWNCRLNRLFHKSHISFSLCGDAFKRERAWARQAASTRFPIDNWQSIRQNWFLSINFYWSLLRSVKKNRVSLNNIVIQYSSAGYIVDPTIQK